MAIRLTCPASAEFRLGWLLTVKLSIDIMTGDRIAGYRCGKSWSGWIARWRVVDTMYGKQVQLFVQHGRGQIQMQVPIGYLRSCTCLISKRQLPAAAKTRRIVQKFVIPQSLLTNVELSFTAL
jgi:hypothetical protein